MDREKLESETTRSARPNLNLRNLVLDIVTNIEKIGGVTRGFSRKTYLLLVFVSV